MYKPVQRSNCPQSGLHPPPSWIDPVANAKVSGNTIDVVYPCNPPDIKHLLADPALTPIDDTLHVVVVVSNPCLYLRRYQLMQEFIRRMENDPASPMVAAKRRVDGRGLQPPIMRMYVVELVYGTQKFYVTRSDCPTHLQLRTDTPPLWHKENLINLAVQRLLPKTWKAVAWVDADVEFDSPTWVADTLRILNGPADIVQLFSHCVDMDAHQCTMNVFNSAGFQYVKRVPYGTGKHQWHPGFAWACTRAAYERMGGLYDYGILGSGDNIMLMSLLGHGLSAIHAESTTGYKVSVLAFQIRVQDLRFAYVPGVIRHYYHGTKENRRYVERWKILVDHAYDPLKYVRKLDSGAIAPFESHSNCPLRGRSKQRGDGLIVPVESVFPPQLAVDIFQYFYDRNEDDCYVAAIEPPTLEGILATTLAGYSGLFPPPPPKGEGKGTEEERTITLPAFVPYSGAIAPEGGYRREGGYPENDGKGTEDTTAPTTDYYYYCSCSCRRRLRWRIIPSSWTRWWSRMRTYGWTIPPIVDTNP
jgi:hypothetical protein